MNAYVIDTHALFWYLVDSPKLSKRANIIFDEGDAGLAQLHVPAIVLAELYFTNENMNRPLNFAEAFIRLQQAPQFVLSSDTPEHTLDFDLTKAAVEMHDRMIVGLALRRRIPLVTRDKRITASNLVQTIW